MRIKFTTRAFQSYVPKQALRAVAGEPSHSLYIRMRKHHADIGGLAAVTGLDVNRVKLTVLGEKPPISTRGCWTKEAVRIARALGTEPEIIFGEAFDSVGSALVHPDHSMLPEVLIDELHPWSYPRR
jgi:hypothetical protein